ncbi:hypothetical protein ES708_28438 [subsurface metagenome]
MPNPIAIAATSFPTFPYAWIPRVFPFSSLPGFPSKQFLATYTIMPKTSSATALEFCPGVFITTIPFADAASRSILSYPAPARTMIFKFSPALITSLSALSLRTIRASTFSTDFTSSSWFSYFSRSINS